ncbi:uncharacterized protein LOC143525129 [Brachyhypopomus gauderio]|uniref:uncharacterized protein LOC143525129 n=1 Tax=Brachyhypopomus gauderio TaxID=698409 RepID=UPI0040436A11
MDLFRQLALFAALLMFTCTHAAPARAKREVSYIEGRSLSISLNEKARYLYKEIESPNEIVEISDPPLMIRPEDQCDPESLRSNAEPCLLRIVLALKNYSRIFGDNGFFHVENSDCSKWRTNATAVDEVIKQLLDTLQEPLDSSVPLNLPQWMMGGYLCRDSADRLYSFSIVVARVFGFLGSLPQTV